jgi:hypothetical protein
MSEMFLINRCHLNKLFLTNDVKCILILFEYLCLISIFWVGKIFTSLKFFNKNGSS